MSGAAGGAAGGGAAAAAAAIAEAVKASGAIVRIEAKDLEDLVRRAPDRLLIHSPPRGMFSRNHRYLTSYRGFVFFAESREEIFLPRGVEVVTARQIWIPS